MTLLFAEGFEGYSINEAHMFFDYFDKGASTVIGSYGRSGNSLYRPSVYDGLTFRAGANFVIDKTDFVIIGFAVKFGNNIDGFIKVYNHNSVSHGISLWYSNGNISIYRTPGALEGFFWTIPKVIDLNTWYYVEMKFIPSNTGRIIVRIDEEEMCDWSPYDFNPTNGTEQFAYLEFDLQVYDVIYLDDIYVADSSGTFNNDLLGDIRIDNVHPNGAGNYTQFTPSAGANYECVDDNPYDAANYVSHITLGEKDSYTYEAVPTDLDDAAIFGILLKNQCQRTAGTDNVKIKGLLRTGSTDYEESTAQSLPDSFKSREVIWEKDPSDSNIWTQAKINACEFGMEVN